MTNSPVSVAQPLVVVSQTCEVRCLCNYSCDCPAFPARRWHSSRLIFSKSYTMTAIPYPETLRDLIL